MTHEIAQLLRFVADLLDPPAPVDLSTARARRQDAINRYAVAERELFAAVGRTSRV